MQFLPRQCEASLCQECKLRSYATFKSSRYDFIPIECQRDSWKNSQCVLEVQDSLYYQGLIENRILSMDQKWTGNGFSSSVSIGLMLTNHTEINTIRKYQFTSSTLIWVSMPSPGEESGFGLLKTNWITLSTVTLTFIGSNVVYGPFSSGVALQFLFLLHYTTSQRDCWDPLGCKSHLPCNQITYINSNKIR